VVGAFVLLLLAGCSGRVHEVSAADEEARFADVRFAANGAGELLVEHGFPARRRALRSIIYCPSPRGLSPPHNARQLPHIPTPLAPMAIEVQSPKKEGIGVVELERIKSLDETKAVAAGCSWCLRIGPRERADAKTSGRGQLGRMFFFT
jgi:hypothetical protein